LKFDNNNRDHTSSLLSIGSLDVEGQYEARIRMNATKSGYAHFVCSWFRLQLHGSVYIDTNPENMTATTATLLKDQGKKKRNYSMRSRHWGQSCVPTYFPTADKRKGRFHPNHHHQQQQQQQQQGDHYKPFPLHPSQKLGRAEFIHQVETAASSSSSSSLPSIFHDEQMTEPRALKVCEGDTLEVLVGLDFSELKPEPRITLNWPWKSSSTCKRERES
jgi:hypothetical protein